MSFKENETENKGRVESQKAGNPQNRSQEVLQSHAGACRLSIDSQIRVDCRG